MSGVKKAWMNYVKSASEAAARDPNGRVKVAAWLLLLLLVGYSVPRAQASALACGPCMSWAAPFCAKLVAAGGACAAVAAFPPALCSCLLLAGGLGCVAAVGTCVAVCLAPTP